jgi:uncharacterized protein YecT (DUF1311 family)
MRWAWTVFLALAILCGASVKAQDNEDACDDPGVDTGQCLAKVLKSAERSLNQSYRDARRDCSPRDRANLARAQRAWLRYREAACKADYDFHDHDVVSRRTCLIRFTTQRIDDIGATYHPLIVDYWPDIPGDPDPPVIPLAIDLTPLSFIWSSTSSIH